MALEEKILCTNTAAHREEPPGDVKEAIVLRLDCSYLRGDLTSRLPRMLLNEPFSVSSVYFWAHLCIVPAQKCQEVAVYVLNGLFGQNSSSERSNEDRQPNEWKPPKGCPFKWKYK